MSFVCALDKTLSHRQSPVLEKSILGPKTIVQQKHNGREEPERSQRLEKLADVSATMTEKYAENYN